MSRSAPIAYFADPAPEALVIEAAIGVAYEEARAKYGDEDGDAWLAALEDGTHPLCSVKTERRALAERLIDTLEESPDPAVEGAWLAEARRRLEDIRAGRSTSVPWDEARARIFARG